MDACEICEKCINCFSQIFTNQAPTIQINNNNINLCRKCSKHFNRTKKVIDLLNANGLDEEKY